MAAVDKATATQEIPTATVADHQALLQALRERTVGLARELIVAHHRHVVRRFRQEVALEQAGSIGKDMPTSYQSDAP